MNNNPKDLSQEFAERVRDSAEVGIGLRLCGGGTKAFYGGAVQGVPEGVPFDVRGHCGVLDYAPTELVITARAGTPVQEVQATLAAQGQYLPFDPPLFATDARVATVGGCVAAGLAGPGRARVGSVRDYVLGVRLINGRGEILRFGGQVMKNVAGFDLSRLMAGSMGTLGLMLEISFKVLPTPPAQSSISFEMSPQAALSAMNQYAKQALPILAICYHEGRMVLRLAGAESAIKAAQKTLGGEAVADEEVFWASVREQEHDYFKARPVDQALWRFSLPTTAAPLALPGKQFVEWNGAQRWLYGENLELAALRAEAARLGGAVSCFRGTQTQSYQSNIPESLLGLHRRLKLAFDPQGIFNPGRLFPDL